MARKGKKFRAPPPPAPVSWPSVVFRPPPIERPKARATTVVTLYPAPPPEAGPDTPDPAPTPVRIPEAIASELIDRIEPPTRPLPRLMIQVPPVEPSRNWTVPVPIPVIESQTPAPPARPSVVLDDGQRIEFGHRVLIGRAPVAANAADIGSMIALPDSDRSVSNTHLRVEVFPAGPYVTDVGSATGVKLRFPNGMVMPTVAGVRTPVEPGCTVIFGQRCLQITVPDTF